MILDGICLGSIPDYSDSRTRTASVLTAGDRKSSALLEKAVEMAMAVSVSAFGLLFGRRSLSGSPIGGIPETQEISSRQARFYATPESISQEGTPCSVRRKTGCGIVLTAKSLHSTIKAVRPFRREGRSGKGLR